MGTAHLFDNEGQTKEWWAVPTLPDEFAIRYSTFCIHDEWLTLCPDSFYYPILAREFTRRRSSAF